MELLDALQWRYATKKMDASKTVTEAEMNAIIEAIKLTPTSSGLQPFKNLVISNPELRQQILPIAFNQQQIVDSSFIIVFASWDNYTEERINQIFDYTNTERGLPLSTTDEYKNRLWGMYSALPEHVNAAHAAKQSYIAFGTAIATAAMLKVDTTPMEGFDNQALDTLLGLDKEGFKSQTILAVGHRAAEGDWLQSLKKVRRPESEFVTYIK